MVEPIGRPPLGTTKIVQYGANRFPFAIILPRLLYWSLAKNDNLEFWSDWLVWEFPVSHGFLFIVKFRLVQHSGRICCFLFVFFHPCVPAAFSHWPAVHILVMWPHIAHASLPWRSLIGYLHRMDRTQAMCTQNFVLFKQSISPQSTAAWHFRLHSFAKGQMCEIS